MAARRRSPALSVLLLLLAVLAGCADGTSADQAAAEEPLPDADSTVTVTGLDHLAWDTESLHAEPGAIEVVLGCEDRVNHNFVIDETGEEVVACRPGETRRGVVELEAGEYTFVCTVPGHESTMRGTLTVQEG